jgi:sulfhydrogenase subunit beta (sulfur reductase)
MAQMLRQGPAGLKNLAARLLESGARVVAPVILQGRVRLESITGDPGQEPCFNGPPPLGSIKDVLLPAGEPIAAFRRQGNDFRILDLPPAAPETVVLGLRPCDGAALATLDGVFDGVADGDARDVFYNRRRAATTIVVLACDSADEHCFCTTQGGSPRGEAGADVLLVPADGGRQLLWSAITDKGRALAARVVDLLGDTDAAPDPAPVLPVRFDGAAVRAWCESHFEDPLWEELGLPCLGCGACAWACPVCHCFDIQDECAGADCLRLRNPDSCAFAGFTRHSGGHNPRADQTARWRRRVLHKFQVLPGSHGLKGCTGCGRCARTCPAGQSILESCITIEAAATAVAP